MFKIAFLSCFLAGFSLFGASPVQNYKEKFDALKNMSEEHFIEMCIFLEFWDEEYLENSNEIDGLWLSEYGVPYLKWRLLTN